MAGKHGSSAEEPWIWLPAYDMRGSALRSERTYAALREEDKYFLVNQNS